MKTTLIDNDLTLAVEDAIPASPVYAPEEILALAVCASPNGSRDAGDLALLHAARERGITLPYAQRENSWEAPSRERPYSTAVLKAADKADASPFMVARGNLKALEKLCEVSSLEKERMNKAFEEHSPSGFEPVAVAVHRSGAPWRLLGVVPMHAMRDVRRLSMAKANFRYFHVWDWPLRVLHWTWVLCIIGLSATGICIAEGWFLKMGGFARGFPIRNAPLRALRAGVDSGGGDDAAFFLLFHGLQQIPEFPGPVPRFQTGVEGFVRHSGGLPVRPQL